MGESRNRHTSIRILLITDREFDFRRAGIGGLGVRG